MTPPLRQLPDSDRGPSSPADTSRLAVGSGVFEVEAADSGPLRVWYHRPPGFDAASPVVFVMHGVLRNARDYRDNWAAQGDTHGALIVAPEFPAARFPGARAYNLGSLKQGAAVPAAGSSFSSIERIFEALRAMTGTRQRSYRVFGHSAGAQFVHRLVMFEGTASIETALAANAGWYTLPDPAVRFPYGLGRMSYGEDRLRQALGRRLIVLVGEADTLEYDPHLRTTRQAMRQGRNRFERAQHFFEAAQAAAERLRTPFAWRLVKLPGVGHDDAAVAAPAARLLLGESAA